MNQWGAAAKFNFDDPNKWVTVPDVPLLDEHTMTDDNGQPIAEVDRQALEEIARNNNKKVYDTGDPATLILGHTSDDPRAEEKPAQGFVVNYKVKPFKRNKDGQVIYAIHGDYKLRPNKAHLVDEYPRRSVELWWHKKDIDPIAMLGGSSPERDLGAVLRHARMNHVSMNTSLVPGSTVRGSSGSNFDSSNESGVIKFSRYKASVIETYTIDDNTPTHKYSKRRISSMNNRNGKHKPSRYSEGEDEEDNEEEQYSPEDLARMRGNDAKARKDIDRKKQKEQEDKEVLEGRRERRKLPPFQNSRGPSRYAEIEDDEDSMPPAPSHKSPHRQSPREIDEGPDEVDEDYDGDEMSTNIDHEPERYDMSDMHDHTEDYDGGDEAIPDEDEDKNDNSQMSPAVQELLQCKPIKEMQSNLDQIKQMLQGLMGGGQGQEEGMGDPSQEGMDGEGMGGEEMPSPQSPNTGMNGQAPPSNDPIDQEQEGPEEDQRSMHGQKPVKMAANSTGMPGPSSGYIPGFVKGQKSKSNKMSRGSNMPQVQRRSRQEDKRDRIIRDLRIQLSRMKAQADIQQLEQEGILFGPTQEVADRIKYQRQEELTLAYLHDEDSGDEGEPDTYVRDKIEEMRMCYSRRKPSPVRRDTPNHASVARYARSEADVAGVPIPEQSDDDFEDKLGTVGSFEAINEFANIQAQGKSRQDAIKYCRKKYGIR